MRFRLFVNSCWLFVIVIDGAHRSEMKGFCYVVSLLLSLPNLIAGTASLVLRHSFATRHPLQIVTKFLFQVVWGSPLAAIVFLVLLVLGIIARTRTCAVYSFDEDTPVPCKIVGS